MAANRKRSGAKPARRKNSGRSGGRVAASLGLVALGSVLAFAATAWFGMPDLDRLKRSIAGAAPPAKVERTARPERARLPAQKPDRSIETAALPVPRPSKPVPQKTREEKPLPAVARPPAEVAPTPKAEVPNAPVKAALPTAPKNATRLAGLAFPICGERAARGCVVDGDTFVLDGKAIRVADIEVPAAGDPKCRREAMLADKARSRLRELLSAGPLELVAASDDKDIYGRKLRTVMRDGRSIGDAMIAEGLARRPGGSRQTWCG